MRNWGSNLEGIHFDNISTSCVPAEKKQGPDVGDWPTTSRNTYDRLAALPEGPEKETGSGLVFVPGCSGIGRPRNTSSEGPFYHSIARSEKS